MLLTLLIFVLLLLAISWFLLDRRFNWETDIGAIVTTVILGICFVVNCIVLCTNPISVKADIKGFEAIRQTVKDQRLDSFTTYERATITQKIMDKNEWLANSQFWAKSAWLNWYYNKSILKVEPIK